MAILCSVVFYILGCKFNYLEIFFIGCLFEEVGYLEVGFKDGVDIYVINICFVIDFVDKKCWQIVCWVLKYFLEVKVVVVGCYVQFKLEEIFEIEGVDLVFGVVEKFCILNYVEELSKVFGKGMVCVGEVKEVNEFVNVFFLVIVFGFF